MLPGMAPLPSFVPRETGRKPAWPRLAVTLGVLAVYLASAALQQGPIQVWLLVLFPFAFAAIGTLLQVIDPSDRG